MVMVKCFIIMDAFMKAIGKIIKKKDLVFIIILIKQNMLEISTRI